MKSIVLASAAFVALSVGATGAHAGVLKSDVYGHDANGPLYNTSQPFGFTSNTDPVSHTIAMPSGGIFGTGNGSGLVVRSSHFGAASAAQQTLRAAADLRVDSLPGGGVDASAKTETHFRKEVVVSSGTSGLANGTPIRLNLALRLDGAARTGFINHAPPGSALIIPLDYRLLTSADISFSYGVTDLNQGSSGGGGIEGGPGGSSSLALASLSSFGKLWYDYQGNDSTTPNTLFSSRHYGWEASSTVNGVLPGEFVDDYDEVAGDLPGSTAYTLDTGLLALQIDTFVGNTLAIEGYMDIFLQAYAWDDADYIAITASSLGDFGSTFDAELTSSVAGIVLEGELPGVYLAGTQPPVNGVPEPMTLSLLGAGLAGIGLMRRRSLSRVAPDVLQR